MLYKHNYQIQPQIQPHYKLYTQTTDKMVSDLTEIEEEMQLESITSTPSPASNPTQTQTQLPPPSIGRSISHPLISSLRTRYNLSGSASIGTSLQMASLCLAEIACKTEIRRGMVLLAQNINSSIQTCYSFEAKIDILNNMSLREGSQPIIHIENIRQSAYILHLHSNGNILKEGQNGGCLHFYIILNLLNVA